jgi:phospholipid/cholesterol/gamma-HCH transport system ATP-binding protein
MGHADMETDAKPDMERERVIEVKDLVARYEEETIFDRISFEVYAGEIFGVLGGSGCGKSTLLKHLIGLIPPVSGKIVVAGCDVSASRGDDLQDLLKRIGILYQSGALLGSMTLSENVALPIHEYTDLKGDAVNRLVKIKLRLMDLADYANHLPSQISGGMKKRAGLARAMALNPQILFFDEPSAGLDPVTAAELDSLIIHLNKTFGTTMVIVTHELESIFTVAHRVIMLDKNSKKIIAEGDPRYLRDHSKNRFVRRFFNRLPSGADDPFWQEV